MEQEINPIVQETIQSALAYAEELGHSEVRGVHLLHELIQKQAISQLLRDAQIDEVGLKGKIAHEVQKLQRVAGDFSTDLSRELYTVIRQSARLAEKLQQELGIKHIFSTCLSYTSASEFFSPEEKKRIEELIKKQGGEDVHRPKSMLEKYTRNVISEVRDGKIDPVIGRDVEIRRVVQVLCRRTKNNPVLVGEPGVGKTAIVEGLAQRIVNNDVPDSMKDKLLLELDLGEMVAGAKYRGEFEERLKALIQEVKESDGAIVLFIDELHTVVGAGAVEGGLDASNLLKPMLARGEIKTIGATTFDEYKKYIEKDKALERRFQQVQVHEPSVEDTISILRGLRDRYEMHHGVRIRDDALVAAANLSHRYIGGRFLPDKAIDIIDEAASKLKTEIESQPVELDSIERKIRQLEMESSSLAKDEDKKSQERLKEIQLSLENYRNKAQKMRAQWTQEKSKIESLKDLKIELEKLGLDQQRLEREGNYEKAAEIKYGVIPQKQSQLEELIAKKEGSVDVLLRDEIDEDDIALVISLSTGIPVARLNSEEKGRLLALESHIGQRVKGQSEAIAAVANAVRRSKSGLSPEHRPIATLAFLGPTGVGKTELAKSLAEFLFQTEKNMIRIDMSEYMEPHSVARMIGSPPGYVGHEDGGQLTEQVKRAPFSVILFDEFEKAHPEVLNVMLQMFDEGTLTDGKGHKVDFSNTIIILTSNIGGQHILDNALSKEEIVALIRAELTRVCKPEFLNRIDEYIVFSRLDIPELFEIVNREIEKLQSMLIKKHYRVEVSRHTAQFLVEVGYDADMGARPLKRAIEKHLVNPLANYILSQEDPEEVQTLYIDYHAEEGERHGISIENRGAERNY